MRKKNTDPDPTLVLAGDIGGTKVKLGIFRNDAAKPRALAVETFSSGEASGLEALIERFLDRHSEPVSGACFGVAGPVSEGQCQLVNLPWVISTESIRKRFGWYRVWLINDLMATAHAVSHLAHEDISLLKEGGADAAGAVGLIAPGTGLGLALLIPWDGGYRPVPSEGGHVDFAPTDASEIDLWRFLYRRFGHVSLERVISGPGLVHIYEWLKSGHVHPEAAQVRQAIAISDPARVISETAMKGEDPLCIAALQRFCRILGAAARNLALTGMTTGGIYLGGGIPRKILKALETSEFISAFTHKGRFARFLETIPVRVILNDDAALLGAAVHALMRYGQGDPYR